MIMSISTKKRRQLYCPLDIYKSPECGAAHVFAIFFSAQHHSSHKKDTRSRATSERISSSLAFSQMEFADERRVFAERRSSHLPGCPPVGFKVRPHHVCLPEQLWDTHLSSFANQWKNTFFFFHFHELVSYPLLFAERVVGINFLIAIYPWPNIDPNLTHACVVNLSETFTQVL